MENLIFMAYHKATLDSDGKIEVPSCIVTIQEVNEVDCFGENIIAKLNQRYARPNKIIGKIITLDMFKGKQGLQENFYSELEILEYLKMMTDENYHIQRSTKYLSNALAESLFKALTEYNFELARRSGAFKLPS